MNPLSQIAKSLVRKSGEVSTAPFYSAIDKSLSSLPNKALGDQFIKEMLKSGVKPQEIIDRNIDVILGSPIVKKTRTVKLKKPDKKGRTEIEEKYFEVTPSAKGSKAIKREDVDRIAAENPPPSITEKVEKGPSDIKYRVEHDYFDNKYHVVDDYGDSVKSFRDYDDAEFYAGKLEGGTTKYEGYQVPGGKNYREIKIMLPTKKIDDSPEFWRSEALRRTGRTLDQLSHSERQVILADVRADQAKAVFKSSHFPEPNILAHARVADRTAPTYTINDIADIERRLQEGLKTQYPKTLGSGASIWGVKNGVITPLEAAQISHARGWSNDTTGAVNKILHIEEIQSDWHQAGRKKGYGPKIEKNVEAYYETKDGQRIPIGFGKTKEEAEANIDVGWKNLVDIKYETIENKIGEGLPDAPFKQNWHELVMKRLLDDAVKKGYDKVVITPGAEQAKRYDLSKHFGELSYKHNEDGTISIIGTDKKSGLANLHEEDIPQDKLSDYVGKELAEKIMANAGTPYEGNSRMRQGSMTISNLDLKVGGEGMEGFYDKMLPSFLNDYGKKWGAKVGQYELSAPRKQPISTIQDAINEGLVSKDEVLLMDQSQRNALMDSFKNETVPVHSFDITPQMREEITQKGQPLYQFIPAGVGVGTLAEPQEQLPEQPAPMKKGGKVKNVTMDSMRLALMDKQLRKHHG